MTGTRLILSTFDDQQACAAYATKGIEDFKQVARELISDGAEILIPGCGLMAPVMRLAPGADDYPKGLTEVDGFR